MSKPPDDGWDKTPHQTQAFKFYTDPAKNPLSTPSGLLEFESTALIDNFPDDKERPYVAHYIRGGPEEEGWLHDEDRIISKKAKEYPLLMVSSVSSWRRHGMGMNIPWTREIERIKGFDGYMYQPVWISLEDAAERGIENGDIVRIHNERGSVLGGAVVTEKIIPGAVNMDKSGGFDPITDRFNRGGSINVISPSDPLSYHAFGATLTSYLVQIEKVTGNMMDEWRKNYPDSFEREKHCDPAYGASFHSWVEGGV
jgi:trimethylamine-N-oxide reductase (cytochrome c)